MKKYALINEKHHKVVSLIVCHHDYKVPEGHYHIELNNEEVRLGFIYDNNKKTFSKDPS